MDASPAVLILGMLCGRALPAPTLAEPSSSAREYSTPRVFPSSEECSPLVPQADHFLLDESFHKKWTLEALLGQALDCLSA
jgi:hypothetical protein